MRQKHKGKAIVRVGYFNEDGSPPDVRRDTGGGYAFVWPFRQAPRIGSIALTDQDASKVAVLGFGTDYTGELRSLKKLLPGNAVEHAEALDGERLVAARRALKGSAPRGTPPAAGTAHPAKAADYGSWWWRTYKLAQEQGAPDAPSFKAVAEHWYAIRDAAKSRQNRQASGPSAAPQHPVSAGKVIAAIFTCGLSLPFTRGVRSRQ